MPRGWRRDQPVELKGLSISLGREPRHAIFLPAPIVSTQPAHRRTHTSGLHFGASAEPFKEALLEEQDMTVKIPRRWSRRCMLTATLLVLVTLASLAIASILLATTTYQIGHDYRAAAAAVAAADKKQLMEDVKSVVRDTRDTMENSHKASEHLELAVDHLVPVLLNGTAAASDGLAMAARVFGRARLPSLGLRLV